MAYKLKPNYHFKDTTETGIDKVPNGRFVIIEDFDGNIVWSQKVSSTGLTSESTIQDAINGSNLTIPLNDKRNISDSYSITEIQALQSLYRTIVDSYSKDYIDENFRMVSDSYSASEVLSMVSQKQDKFVNVPTNSKGSDGDLAGDIAFNASYIYYCTMNYDGTHNIWARAPFTLTTW